MFAEFAIYCICSCSAIKITTKKKKKKILCCPTDWLHSAGNPDDGKSKAVLSDSEDNAEQQAKGEHPTSEGWEEKSQNTLYWD